MQDVILFTHQNTVVNNFVSWTLDNYAGQAALPITNDHFYELPKGQLLHAVAIIPTTDITLSIGSSPGAADIQPAIFVKANEPLLTTIGRYAAFAPVKIFFTGIDSDALVTFFKF
ncbi:hypothetical protein SAMN05444266_101606 [Chitinophaga jiangningensis]|uniref:Uncharacterized protein n=1 Tax=Chitinophaga jiangningensis TaxID=1419482 RepID=A0A1M6WFS5_9BACT|nr:hypothetical protein [Chitinophaga jiangningensis]SHK92464.1 hypothetical protein SAMN05444266_101606 [Chitinophaga jiangningensis]